MNTISSVDQPWYSVLIHLISKHIIWLLLPLYLDLIYHLFFKLSPLKQSPKLFASAGLSPFKRLSFGRKTEPEEPSNDKGPPKPIRINLTDLSDPVRAIFKFYQIYFFHSFCHQNKNSSKMSSLVFIVL